MPEENKSEEPKKRRRRRTVSTLSAPDRELLKTMRRLGMATKGMHASAELLKAAALQIVAHKLEEVSALLRAVGFSPNGLAQNASPQSGRPLTVESVTQLVNTLDGQNRPATSVQSGKTCQICGRPAVYRTKRGMELCMVHRPQGLQDDKADKLRDVMAAQGGSGDEEIIMVPADVINNALAAQNANNETEQ